jgi:hypothetical protein
MHPQIGQHQSLALAMQGQHKALVRSRLFHLIWCTAVAHFLVSFNLVQHVHHRCLMCRSLIRNRLGLAVYSVMFNSPFHQT